MCYVALLKDLGLTLQNNRGIWVPTGLCHNVYVFWEEVKVSEIPLLSGFVRRNPIIDASVLHKENFIVSLIISRGSNFKNGWYTNCPNSKSQDNLGDLGTYERIIATWTF
jgi:hypothetical protein